MHRILFTLVLLLAGCASGGGFAQKSTVQVQSRGMNSVILLANCSTIVCTSGFANEGEIWMTDIPIDELTQGNSPDGQIIHLQLLWTPVAGKTPLASTSTNLAIKHIIIADGEVGVYGGGGYCWPKGSPSSGMRLDIEEATIALQNRSSSRFIDLLTPATMTGELTSRPDAITARQIATAARRIAP